MAIDIADKPEMTAAFVAPDVVYSASPRPAAFLDRDGVINWDFDYVGRIAQCEFTPGIGPFLKKLQDKGYVLVVVTNQSGVGKDKFTENDYVELRSYMHAELAKQGVRIDMEMSCFAHAQAVFDAYKTVDHSWRKPNPGMINFAAAKLNIDLKKSFLLGDKISDVEAGLNAGLEKNIVFTAGFQRKDSGDILTVKMANAFKNAHKAADKIFVAASFDDVCALV